SAERNSTRKIFAVFQTGPDGLDDARMISRKDGCKAEVDVEGRVGDNVCFTSQSEHSLPRLACPLCAKSRHSAIHSITSSARASSDDGTSRPSAFAVLRLKTSSYLVAVCTGRSAGFSPLSMRST